MTSTKFDFDRNPATIEHINLRKEGPKDGKVVGVDLKITVEDLPLRCLAALLFASPADVEQAFWRIEDIPHLNIPGGDKVDRRFIGMRGFESSAEYKDRHALKLGDLPEVRVSKLAKFDCLPQAGQTTVVTFTASIADPPQEWISSVAKMMREPVEVTLLQDAELNLDVADSTSASDKARKAGKKKKTEKEPPAAATDPASEMLELDAPKEPLGIEGPQRRGPLAISGPVAGDADSAVTDVEPTTLDDAESAEPDQGEPDAIP